MAMVRDVNCARQDFLLTPAELHRFARVSVTYAMRLQIISTIFGDMHLSALFM